MKVWIVSTCVPGSPYPCLPVVFSTEAEAEAYVADALKEDWTTAALESEDGAPIPWPGNWREAMDMLREAQAYDEPDEQTGFWEITCHEITPPPLLVGVFLEGGVIQAVSADDPANAAHITVVSIDYDTEDCEDDNLTPVPQDDGKPVPAWVFGHTFHKHEPACDIVAGALANKMAGVTWADHLAKEEAAA